MWSEVGSPQEVMMQTAQAGTREKSEERETPLLIQQHAAVPLILS